MPGGRPTEYTEEVVIKAQEYLSDDETKNYVSYGHTIPSIVGLCRVINRGKSTIYDWAQDPDNEFSDMLCVSKEFQELVVLNKTLTGELNPQIGKLVLYKHGYSEKIEQETVANVTVSGQMSDEELEKIAGGK